MSISTDDLGRITQQTSVVASDGDRLGAINQIYTSDTTGEPAWATLKTGLFGTQESFVPLVDATFEGDEIHVPVTKQAVHDAPRVDADGHLSVEEEDDLYRYYGLHNPGQPRDMTDAAADDRRTETDRIGTDRTDSDLTGRTETDTGTGTGTDVTGRADEGTSGRDSAGVGAGAAGAAAAVTNPDRDEELAQRDVEGRDEVADRPEVTPPPVQDDRPTTTEGDDEGVRPGERTTQLRRYVVTERVVQTIEELPDEPSR
jgi:hypothetical protein